jgi:Predicted dehydrogenases and related proteins
MSERLRVAVVGGGIGVSHIKAYVQLPEMFELVAICDIDTAKAERISQEFGIPRVVADFSELCRMDDIDVIDICTPPHLHYPQALEVLAAGKHAICEKPLVGSLKQADELAIAEKQSGRRLMPIFQYRFGHGLQKLKFLIQEGLAGTTYLSTVETAWRRRAAYYDVPWRGKWATELGGAVLGHAIHTHDMLCYVLGPVKQVFARTNTRVNPIEVEDCASASLLMADGSLASLSVTLGSSEEISRHRFCFSNFVAESNLRPYTNSGDPWRFIGDTPELSEQIEKTLERFQPLPEGHAGQFYRFYQAITQGGELPVTIADARASLELVTAIYYSSQTNQPVDLPIGTDHPKYESWLP